MSRILHDFIKYSIKIGSKALDSSYPIQSIIIDKRINKIPYAEIVLHDGSIQSQIFSIANDKTFAIGNTATIQAGYGDSLEALFEGVVATLSVHSRSTGLSTLTVTCRDIAHETTITPQTTHFEKTKDSDLFKKILGKYSGLKNKLESTSITHENISQREISDWDFINIRAEANGQVVVVNDGVISVKKPNTTGKGLLTYTYGADFINFDAEIDVKDQWASITALSWDSTKQSTVSEKADEPGEQSMGDLSYKKLTAATKQNPVVISHCGLLDASEIKTLATGLLSRSRIAKIKGVVTVSGNAKLLHDHLVTIEKGATHFSGDAYVSGVRHLISNGTWQTELTIGLPAQRYIRKYNDIGSLPAAGMMPPIHGVQLGIVKQITGDPKNQNRILVNLPVIHNNPKEGIWCHLTSFYTAPQSGALFIPELETPVVVDFFEADIRNPIILGSLYIGKHEPSKKIDDRNLFKSFISKEKLELTFNDDKEGPEITIKTPKGGLLKLSDKQKNIEITDENGNTIVLSKDGINITSSKDIILSAKGNITLKSDKNIDIQGGQNITMKSMNINAKASMKAILSGNSSTEVQSAMATIIKGTTVLIN